MVIGPRMIQRTLQRPSCLVKELLQGANAKVHPLCDPVFLDKLLQGTGSKLRDVLLLLEAGTLQLHAQPFHLLGLCLHGCSYALNVRCCPIIYVSHPNWCSHAVHGAKNKKRTENCLKKRKQTIL